jgi:hypothetical protein
MAKVHVYRAPKEDARQAIRICCVSQRLTSVRQLTGRRGRRRGVTEEGLPCVSREAHGKDKRLLCARPKTHGKKASNSALLFALRP